MKTLNKASRDYTVLFYHVDQKHDLSISSLFDFYTEVAYKHTVMAGYDLDYLEKNKLKWMLYKIKVKVSRYPRIQENIRVSTWGENIIKFNAFRKFEIIDENGEVLSTGESIWLMVNSETMRPVRIPDEMYDGYKVERGKTNRIEIETLENPGSRQNKRPFSVNYSDLDYNQHANSARYIDWALETIPYEVRTGYDLSEITVNYLKELIYGDPVISVSRNEISENLNIYHHGIITSEEKPAALMKSVWKPR